MNADQLDKYLSYFVFEVRKSDGSEYPPKSLYILTTGLNRYLQDVSESTVNVLNVNDFCFHLFRSVLDARMKQLHSAGIGVP